MSIRISHVDSRLKLIFDRPTMRISRDQLEMLRQKLSSVDGVASVKMQRAWYGRRQIVIVFASELEPHAMLRKMASALRPLNEQGLSHAPVVAASATRDVGHQNGRLSGSQVTVAMTAGTDTDQSRQRSVAWHRRLRELGYGFLAVGSFGMAWVGLLIPGIPTVPFVILTAHFALQASPALRKRLLKSKMFGPMMRDWQEHRAIHRSMQIEAYIFTVIIIAISFAIAPPNPILYAVMVFMGALGLILISRIPIIQVTDEENSDQPLSQVSGVAPAVV